MSCSSCGTKSGGSCSPAGCKGNGSCSTGGCNALNVYDWFKDMDFPEGYTPFNVVEVRFKGSRKEFFKNSNNIDLFTGDYVVVDSSIGFDVGTVSATGEIVRLQLKKYRVPENHDELPSIQRIATEKDIEKHDAAKAKEDDMLERARTIAFGLKLQMKISDIELQADGRKVIFFYTAETRVDFRELIKRYADEFRVKIEMRHISYREEASRLGGIGVCGRELCCSTWLTDYKQVNTGAARMQNLSINMEKLAGQCGRLKCCLNYELDLYTEALSEFPKAKVIKIDTEIGVAYARKTDILKKLMWFAYDDQPNWIPLQVSKVNELIEENKEGKISPNLADFSQANELLEKAIEDTDNDFIDNNELLKDDEFSDLKDLPKNKNRRYNNRNNNNNRGRDNRNPNNDNRGQNNKDQENRNSENRNPERDKRDNRNQENRPKSDGGDNRDGGQRKNFKRNNNLKPPRNNNNENNKGAE